ncbi:MAG: hypothetical protein LBR50_11130 [Tannerella sp.]|jgi:hypothetical protein|nr:hypothetical protein [Tannerella sp.]
MNTCSQVAIKTFDNSNAIIQLANAWKKNTSRPRPSQQICDDWDKVLEDWVNDPDLPLFVRKGNERGTVFKHKKTNRDLIPVDNSPAQWAFSMACDNKTPILKDLVTDLKNGNIPIAMVPCKSAVFRGSLAKSIHNVNTKGWKLAHIKPVGLNTRQPVEDIDIDELKDHHKKLLSPSNMFVVPLKYSGIAEIDEFINVFP